MSSDDQDFELIENLPFNTKPVIGARARIGLVVLASDYTMEHEFRSLIDLQGVDVFHARISNSPAINPASLAAMGPLITQTAETLLPGDTLSVLAYGCTSATTVLGEDAVHTALSAAKPDTPTTNPITAAFAALNTFGVKRIAILTPYRRDVNEIVRQTFVEGGFEVPVFGSFNEEMDPVVAAIDDASLRDALLRLIKDRDVDAVFVSCTSIRLADQIAALEAETGLPITSSNHAMAWHCLRLAEINTKFEGRGRLFLQA